MWPVLCLLLSHLPAASTGPGLTPLRADIVCPTIRIFCPDTAIFGETVTFKASLTSVDPSAKLSYKWTVSAGTITEGQGTASIKVYTMGLGLGGGRSHARGRRTGFPL